MSEEREVQWIEYTALLTAVSAKIIPAKDATITIKDVVYRRSSGRLLIQPKTGLAVIRYGADPSATNGMDIQKGIRDTDGTVAEVRGIRGLLEGADVSVCVCFEGEEAAV